MAKRRKGSALSRISTADLAREIEKRRSEVTKLIDRRDRLAKELSELDAQISMLAPGSAVVRPVSTVASKPARGKKPGAKKGKIGKGAPGRKRPHNDLNLAESLQKVLKNRTMSVTEVTAEVQKAGYKTSAENFRTIVNQTLIRDTRFKKVSRGKYTAA